MPKRKVSWTGRDCLTSPAGRERYRSTWPEQFGIRDYPCPAGGCLLTDKEIAARLRDLFAYVPNYDMADLQLLKIGRHFRLNPALKVIVGRNREDNEKIRMFAEPGSIIFIAFRVQRPDSYHQGDAGRRFRYSNRKDNRQVQPG